MPKSQLRKQMCRNGHLWIEITIRIALVILFISLEKVQPFERKIHPDELWLYKNPRTESYIPSQALWPIVVLAPLGAILILFFIQRNAHDAIQSFLALTLSLGLNGLFTDVIKLVVGRPRPDFFWRCFPDGQANSDISEHVLCHGDPAVITEGRKSFPSGHSSFSFASLGFISLYIGGKMGVFNVKGRGRSLRLITFLLPLLMAMTIALSRTCDYHHHWQDVLCGSILGMAVTYMSYRQYYPPLDAVNAEMPLMSPPAPAATVSGELPFKWV